MAMDVNAVMDGIGDRLGTIPGLNVFDFMPASFSPPAAAVSFPENALEYDLTMGRGADSAEFIVYVFVGNVDDSSARRKLAGYISGTGAQSVKSVIEFGDDLGGAAQSVRVSSCEVEVIDHAGQQFLTARFVVQVIA